MADNFNVNDFARLAKTLFDKYDVGDEFLLGHVHQQTREAYERFPEDAVIRQMASVIDKMAEKQSPATIINQKQLSAIYNDIVRLAGDTKFRLVLGHLVFPTPELNKQASSQLRGDEKEIDVKSLIDPQVLKVLENTFDDDLAVKAFNKELANKGLVYVKAELKSIGFERPVIKVAGGDSTSIYYNVGFDTPSGMTSVYVPVKIADNKFILPTTFIDDSGEKELTNSALTASLDRRGGKLQNFTLGIKGAQVDLPEVVIEKTEVPQELAHIARDFEDSLIETSSSFGKEAIDMGKKVIATELRAAGFKNAQVKFGSDSNESVVYLATINTPSGKATIEIPLEMKATIDDRFVPLMPTVFAHNESLTPFNAGELQKFALSVSTSQSTGNPLFAFMTLGELKEELVKYASINEYTTCEEILNHVGETYGEEHYKNAVADYQYILTIKAQAADTQVRYSEISKQAGTVIPAGKGSIYARLPNGKPIKDMIKDENGIYRSAAEIEKQKINPVEESGACIVTSKIIFS